MRRFLFAFVWLCLITNSAFAISPQQRSILFTHKLWTPLNLGSALVAWWDARDVAHIALSGSNVTSWTDKVSGIIASQATGIDQPGWSAKARNGTPGLTFSGSTQFLAFTPTGFPSGSSQSAIAIAAFSNANMPSNQTFVFAYGNSGTTGGHSRLSLQNTTNLISASTSGGTPAAASESWNTQDRFQIINFTGATTVSQNVDGNAGESGTIMSMATDLTTGSIGGWQAFGNSWNGVIQQALVISGNPTASQLAKLAGWESWYDGKAGSNLPSSSRYKYRPPYVNDP